MSAKRAKRIKIPGDWWNVRMVGSVGGQESIDCSKRLRARAISKPQSWQLLDLNSAEDAELLEKFIGWVGASEYIKIVNDYMPNYHEGARTVYFDALGSRLPSSVGARTLTTEYNRVTLAVEFIGVYAAQLITVEIRYPYDRGVLII